MNARNGWRLAFVIAGLVLLLGPLFVRTAALGYNRRTYDPGDLSALSVAATPGPTAVPVSPSSPNQDATYELRPGPVVVDLAHGNNVDRHHFEPLAAALAQRGLGLRYWMSDIDPMTVTNFLDYPDQSDELAALLREASGLVVVSPFFLWSKAEISVVEQFVADGGRLLLISDPDVASDRAQDINGLGEPFGIVFAGDYLYNTSENDGNHIYVFASEYAGDAESLADSQIALYGTRSIAGDVIPQISMGDSTVSNLRPGLSGLSAVVKAGQRERGTEGGVLAMGDFDVLTVPFVERHDNARLTNFVADFLAEGERTQDVTDFPAFLGKDVTLVLANAAAVDAQTLVEGSRLQESLRESGRTLSVAGTGLLTMTVSAQDDSSSTIAESPANDLIVLADFSVADTETTLLRELGFTLVEVTPTPTATPPPSLTPMSVPPALNGFDTGADARPTPVLPLQTAGPPSDVDESATTAGENSSQVPSSSRNGRFTFAGTVDPARAQATGTPDVLLTPTATFTPTPLPTIPPTPTSSPTPAPTTEPSPTPEPEVYLVAADGLRLVAADTVLISQRELDDGRRVVAVLAQDNEGIRSGIDRLLEVRFSGCVTQTDLAVCSEPNGEGDSSMASAALAETPTPEAIDRSSETSGEKLVMVVDDNDLSMPGETSEADLYLKVLTRQGYGPTLWMTSSDGIPKLSDLEGYDWVIWSSGGYESGGPGLADLDPLLGYINVGGSLTISSRRPFFGMSAKEESAIADVAVDDDLPAMVRGLPSTAVQLRNGLPPVTPLEIGEEHAGAKIVLLRGPESSDAGAPLLFVVANDQGDDATGAKLMIAGMSLTWLPEEYSEQLVRNMIGYMTGE